MARRNLQQNPALGASATGFENGTRVSVTGMARPEALRIGNGVIGRGPIVDADINPSTVYTCSLEARPAGNSTINLYVTEMNSAGAFIRNQETLGIAVSAGVAARHYSTLTTTASTQRIRITVQTNVQVDLTAYLIETGSAPNAYADGETAGWAWDGTRYESTSSEASPATGATASQPTTRHNVLAAASTAQAGVATAGQPTTRHNVLARQPQ